MTERIRQQILIVKLTGECNMLDTYAVQQIAKRMNMYDLVIYIEENRKNYTHFIMTGEINED